MNLPRSFRRIIRSLHRTSKGIICVRNLLFGFISLATGVKQGDPSAMQLFILGYDPLIRFISRSLSPVDHLLLPFCDDLALAVSNDIAAWETILRCFDVISRATSLCLNNDKAQFLLTSATKIDDMNAIKHIGPQICDEQFLSVIKYLGIFLGPDCHDANWSNVISDYLSTSRLIASLSCGLLTKILLYDMIAISKRSYIASFLPPNHAAVCAESRALQLLCRGPWNSIPPDLLKSVKKFGMPSQALDCGVCPSHPGSGSPISLLRTCLLRICAWTVSSMGSTSF